MGFCLPPPRLQHDVYWLDIGPVTPVISPSARAGAPNSRLILL